MKPLCDRSNCILERDGIQSPENLWKLLGWLVRHMPQINYQETLSQPRWKGTIDTQGYPLTFKHKLAHTCTRTHVCHTQQSFLELKMPNICRPLTLFRIKQPRYMSAIAQRACNFSSGQEELCSHCSTLSRA